MSFVVALALVLAAIVRGVCLLLFRRRRWLALAAGAVVLLGQLAWYLHPVCRPIDEADLASFDPPIEARSETGMIGQRYFQQRDGRWQHCKTWIARQFFF